MTEVDSYAMMRNASSFRKGATAYRNSRDFSKEYRDCVIAAVNATATLRKASLNKIASDCTRSLSCIDTAVRTKCGHMLTETQASSSSLPYRHAAASY